MCRATWLKFITTVRSALWLGITSRWQEKLGASLIVLGACVSVVPKVSEDSNAWGRLGLLGYGRLRMTSIAEQSRWYAARIEGHRRP